MSSAYADLQPRTEYQLFPTLGGLKPNSLLYGRLRNPSSATIPSPAEAVAHRHFLCVSAQSFLVPGGGQWNHWVTGVTVGPGLGYLVIGTNC